MPHGRPFSPRPGTSGRRTYTQPTTKGKRIGWTGRLKSPAWARRRPLRRRLNKFGKPYGKFDRFPYLNGRGVVFRRCALAQLLQPGD